MVTAIGVAEGDPLGGIADGTDERNKEGRECSMGVVTKAKPSAFQWKVREEVGEVREWGGGVGDVLEEEGGGRVKGLSKG